MEAFLTWLAKVRDVSASTQCQAFCAILSYYRDFRGIDLKRIDALRSTRPATLRTSVASEKLLAVLADLQEPPGVPMRLIFLLLWGCGLRLNEGLNLRVKDVLVKESRLAIYDTKHGGARKAIVPCSLMPAIVRQLDTAKAIAAEDRARGVPVSIPVSLCRKDKMRPFRAPWAFLLPSPRLLPHPDTGELQRWHVPDWTVQRLTLKAARKHDLDGLLSPHILRHSFASEFSGDVKLLQEIMGHKSIETTMVYRHPDPRKLVMPMDELAAELGGKLLALSRCAT